MQLDLKNMSSRALKLSALNADRQAILYAGTIFQIQRTKVHFDNPARFLFLFRLFYFALALDVAL